MTMPPGFRKKGSPNPIGGTSNTALLQSDLAAVSDGGVATNYHHATRFEKANGSLMKQWLSYGGEEFHTGPKIRYTDCMVCIDGVGVVYGRLMGNGPYRLSGDDRNNVSELSAQVWPIYYYGARTSSFEHWANMQVGAYNYPLGLSTEVVQLPIHSTMLI